MLSFVLNEFRWELLNPDAELIYLPHPRPVDGVEITFNKI